MITTIPLEFLALFFFKLIYLVLTVLGPRCCVQAPSSRGERGPPLAVARGPVTKVASPAAEHRLQACGPQQLWHAGSAVVACGLQSTDSAATAHGLSRSAARGISLDQGSNPCPLHWQADPPTTEPPGKPEFLALNLP